MRKFKLGTRGSKLALFQAETVAAALRSSMSGVQVDVVTIVTRGDKAQGEGAAQIYRDKRDWVKEIEDELLRGEIDFAVHSAKDVPEIIEPNTYLVPVLARENPHDALVFRDEIRTATGPGLEQLPRGALIGSSSLRRAAQLLRLRPDLRIEAIGGNVPTRIEKLNRHESMSAIVLAVAGLRRLQLESSISYVFSANEILPAANQGTLAAQFRKDDSEVQGMLSLLIEPECYDCWSAERSCVAALGADCNSSVGAYAVVADSQLKLRARVLAPDGSICIDDELVGSRRDADALGIKLAERLFESGAKELLD